LAGFGLIGLGAGVVAQDRATQPQESAKVEKTSPKASSGRVETKVPPGFELVWSDEFDTPGLPDPKKWKYDTHRNKEGWYNNEKQYYASGRLENSRVENGNLIIEALKEDLSAGRGHMARNLDAAL